MTEPKPRDGSLVDEVYTSVKQSILTGKLKPNTKLVVRSLCEQFGISDTPLKQALNRLVADGLVQPQPRRGMRVKQLTPKDIHESIEARLMIELFAVRPAIESVRRGSDLLKRLEKSIEVDELLFTQMNVSGVYNEIAQTEEDESHNFHLILVENIGNDLIKQTYDNIVRHTYTYYQSGLNKKEQVLASINEHKHILECLYSQDEKSMRKAIRSHLRIREKAVVKLVR